MRAEGPAAHLHTHTHTDYIFLEIYKTERNVGNGLN